MARLTLYFPASIADVIGGDLLNTLNGDPVFQRKVKGTGIMIKDLLDNASEACARTPKVRDALDKASAWVACMDEVLASIAEYVKTGSGGDSEVDGTGVTVGQVAKPIMDACRSTTAKVYEDVEENTRACALDVVSVSRLRLREVFASI
ncbi:hypothetical protein [Infirmifilum sp.]|uniref:hypothetical protein n=1 Tax=Infirmifilum sp. TaxID=2856575 RepID=UPI003D0D2D00